MRFLSRRTTSQTIAVLAEFLTAQGHESIHTLDLAQAEPHARSEIIQIATAENRIVITKDEDFVDSHLLRDEPPRLLLISTGNISNQDLLTLFQQHLQSIDAAFQTADYVELAPNAIVIHG